MTWLCDGHERAGSAGAGPGVSLMCDVCAMVALVCQENLEQTFEWSWSRSRSRRSRRKMFFYLPNIRILYFM